MIDKSEMIFGVRAVIEAIQAGKDIDKILVKKDIQSDLVQRACSLLERDFDSRYSVFRWSVSTALLGKIIRE